MIAISIWKELEGSILDIGGGGDGIISRVYGQNVTAIDNRQEELDEVPDNCTKLCMDARSLAFPDEAFNHATFFFSLLYMDADTQQQAIAEAVRVLKPGGVLLVGFDNGFNYLFDEDETVIKYTLPYNPLKDEALYREAMDMDSGVQFSHTLDEEIGGQLRAGFMLTDIYEDTNGEGFLHEHGVPCFVATRCVKK